METNQVEKPAEQIEDFKFGSMVFAKALHHIFKEGMGVAVVLPDDVSHSAFPGVQTMIVYSLNGTIQIEPATRKLEDGEIFNVLDWANK